MQLEEAGVALAKAAKCLTLMLNCIKADDELKVRQVWVVGCCVRQWQRHSSLCTCSSMHPSFCACWFLVWPVGPYGMALLHWHTPTLHGAVVLLQVSVDRLRARLAAGHEASAQQQVLAVPTLLAVAGILQSAAAMKPRVRQACAQLVADAVDALTLPACAEVLGDLAAVHHVAEGVLSFLAATCNACGWVPLARCIAVAMPDDRCFFQRIGSRSFWWRCLNGILGLSGRPAAGAAKKTWPPGSAPNACYSCSPCTRTRWWWRS